MEKRDFCLATFMPLQFHRFFTLILSIWLVFLRSMIIQRAREIKYKVTKSGRISEDNNLGLLVSLICTTIIVGYVLIIFFHPLFPEGFGDIRMCRGLKTFSNQEFANRLIWLVYIFITGFFVYTSQRRVAAYRKQEIG